MKTIVKFPVILPKKDVLAILAETTNLKHKAILALIYGSGLRVGEVAKLKICDICSTTMRVRVEKAKHNTNRYTILSKISLNILRDYFKAYPFDYAQGRLFLAQITSLMIGCFRDKTRMLILMSKP